jgi:dTDP-4-amino-4,6-dideoxygalactose transaminase
LSPNCRALDLNNRTVTTPASIASTDRARTATPRPRLPARPVPGAVRPAAMRWSHGSALDRRARCWTSSGRAAIALALQHAGIERGAGVLVPEYHCPSMVDPVTFRELHPVYYRLQADLSVDIDDFARQVPQGVRAALVSHFFGRLQPLDAVRALCDRHGVVLIEDCAHAFFGHVGRVGDYAAFSLPKFFPVFEGGLLTSDRLGLQGVPMRAAGLRFEAKAALWAYHHATEYGGALPGHRAVAAVERLRSSLRRDARPGGGTGPSRARAVGPAAAEGSAGLEAEWVDRRPSWFSRAVVCKADFNAVAAARRANWVDLAKRIATIDGLEVPGRVALEPDEVPYALPVEVRRNQETMHRTLKNAGVPVYRWDNPHPSLDAADHPRAVRWSRSLLQIPLHQSLRASELEAIGACLDAAVRGASAAPHGVARDS